MILSLLSRFVITDEIAAQIMQKFSDIVINTANLRLTPERKRTTKSKLLNF